MRVYACYVSAERFACSCSFSHVHVREHRPFCVCFCPWRQHAQSTVALARGIFILLCVGLFIVSQALSQMCTFTALLHPPAWHTYTLLLLFLLLPPLHTHLLQGAAVPKHIGPRTPGGTPSCEVKGCRSLRGKTEGEGAGRLTWDKFYC